VTADDRRRREVASGEVGPLTAVGTNGLCARHVISIEPSERVVGIPMTCRAQFESGSTTAACRGAPETAEVSRQAPKTLLHRSDRRGEEQEDDTTNLWKSKSHFVTLLLREDATAAHGGTRATTDAEVATGQRRCQPGNASVPPPMPSHLLLLSSSLPPPLHSASFSSFLLSDL
jgi:hypothetical protein